MTSLKQVRNQLLIIHDDGVLNDDELLLLYDLNRSNVLDQPYDSFPDFNFDGLKTTIACPNFAFTNATCPFSLSCIMKGTYYRPVTRILCGGVLTRPKWTKLPKCIFFV